METRIPSGQKLPQNWALQDPQDYLNGLEETIHTIMTQNEIYPEEVIGIGIDFTSSTILPVKNNKTPLCQIKPAICVMKNYFLKLKNAMKNGFHYMVVKHQVNG